MCHINQRILCIYHNLYVGHRVSLQQAESVYSICVGFVQMKVLYFNISNLQQIISMAGMKEILV